MSWGFQSVATSVALPEYIALWNQRAALLAGEVKGRQSGLDTYRISDFGNSVGNGNDDTVAIQKAVRERLRSGGGALYADSAAYIFTSPIDFTGTTNKIEFYGKSNLATVLTADFTSVSKCGAFSIANSEATRAYVDFHDFQLAGIGDSNTLGIYGAWTSGFSSFRNLLLQGFYDGMRLANDSLSKVEHVVATGNLSSGLLLGRDLADASAPCNATGVIGGSYTNNGDYGVAVLDSRAFTQLAVTAEANGTANVYWDGVIGGFLGGQYLEFAPAVSGTPTAHWWLKNCLQATGKGISCSAWKATGNAIVRVENTTGLDLSIAEEFTTGSPSDIVGVEVIGSTGVDINTSSLQNSAIAVRLDATSRARIRSTQFASNTQPVVTAASSNCFLEWEDVTVAQANASSFGAGSIVTLDYLIRTGSPEGVVTAQPGNTYLRTDGGASTTLYVKESGVGNTGWVAK